MAIAVSVIMGIAIVFFTCGAICLLSKPLMKGICETRCKTISDNCFGNSRVRKDFKDFLWFYLRLAN